MRRRRPRPPAFSLFSFQDIITSVTGIMILITLMLALEAIQQVEGTSVDSVDAAYDRTQSAIAELQHEVERLKERLAESQARAQEVPPVDVSQARETVARLQADCGRLEREIDAFETRTQSLDQERAREIADAQARESQIADEIARVEAETAELERRLAEAGDRLESLQEGNRVLFKQGVGDKTIWILEVSDRDDRLHCLAGEAGAAVPAKTFESSFEVNRWARTLDASGDSFLIVLKPSGLAHFRKLEEMLSGADRGGLAFDVGVYLIAEDQTAFESPDGENEP